MPYIDVVELNVKQGEDYTGHLLWTTTDGQPMQIKSPLAGAVLDPTTGQILFDLVDASTNPDPNTTAMLAASASGGLIQVSIPRQLTSSLPAGRFYFDIFATTKTTLPPFTTGQRREVISGYLQVVTSITPLN